MADIFISYKREERSQVERLATALRGLGFSVWFDASLSAGETFSDEIDREVRAAAVVLVCWSPAAAGSQWVKAEAQIGFSRSNLISARVAGPDAFEPPVPFNSIHMEDLRAWVERPSARDPAWKSVLRRAGALTDRADIADWGALPADAEAAAIQAWFAAHGAASPLVIEAEAAFTEAQARGAVRMEAEAAARERLARLAVEEQAAKEKEAAERRAREVEARAAKEKEAADKRAREAEARAKRAEGVAKLTRRALVWGGGALGVAAAGASGFGVWHGLEGDTPFLRGAFPGVTITPAGRAAGLRIRPLARLQGHESDVWSAAFSPDGARIVTASGDDTARVWDAATGAEIARLQGHEFRVRSADFSPDGSRVVTASWDRTARVWDAANGAEIARLQGDESTLFSAAFSPDGARIVTASWDATARVWDAATGSGLARLQGHREKVIEAAFSPDGARIVTASWDYTARVWDAATGAELARLQGHKGGVTSVAFGPDGTRIVTASLDKTARVWAVEG